MGERRSRWRAPQIWVRCVLLCVCMALVVVGVHAHAWPRLFKRSANPSFGGVGTSSRVGDVMVQISGNMSGRFGRPGLNRFPWAGTADWTWDPPDCEMYVFHRGSRGKVKRDWVVSWPSHHPKGAVLGVFRTGPGRATIVGVHGAWVWGIGLAGAGALLFGPVRRTVRARRRAKRPWSCAQCGYDLRGIAHDKPCPECGLKRGSPDDGP